MGRVLWIMPSLLPSLRLTKYSLNSDGRLAASTAYPWFWDVMSGTLLDTVSRRRGLEKLTALPRQEVQAGNVVGAVSVLELDGTGADGERQQLVAEADAHDGDRRALHQAGQVVDGLLAVGRVAGAVGDED